jgi:hypothetical protein
MIVRKPLHAALFLLGMGAGCGGIALECGDGDECQDAPAGKGGSPSAPSGGSLTGSGGGSASYGGKGGLPAQGGEPGEMPPVGGTAGGSVSCAPPLNLPATVCDNLGVPETAVVEPSGLIRYCDSGDSAGGTAGAAPGTAGGAGGDGPAAGGAAPATPALFLIDDFEDGDRLSKPLPGGLGYWDRNNDASVGAYQYPEPCSLPSQMPGEHDQSQWSMLTYGCGFSGWGSSMNLVLRSGAPACASPVDGSAYDGVRFLARGNGTIRFMIVTTAVSTLEADGTCAAGCWDNFGVDITLTDSWTEQRIPYSALFQEGWGSPAERDPATLLGIMWASEAFTTFEYAIDDVAFYRD